MTVETERTDLRIQQLRRERAELLGRIRRHVKEIERLSKHPPSDNAAASQLGVQVAARERARADLQIVLNFLKALGAGPAPASSNDEAEDTERREAEKAAAQKRADAAATELIACAQRLDVAETVSDLQQFTKLCAELRSAGRLAASHDAVQVNLARLRKLESASGMPKLRHRTFTALAQSWLRTAPAQAA